MFNLLIVQPIFNLLLGLYILIPGGDFGLSIIIFTIFVRLALYPLLKKQLHQTKAMQKMQPELARIKVESKGDKQVESMRMLELYKKHGISPFRSFLILLIQLPIFIALYQVIQVFATHRDQIDGLTYGFMKAFEPISAIVANPSIINEKFLGIVDLGNSVWSNGSIDIAVLLIVVVSSVLQYLMMKQTMPKTANQRKLRDIMGEASKGKEVDQSEINAVMSGSMIKFMPVMMFFVMAGLPGAVVLYYATSNIIAVVQQHILLKNDAEELVQISDDKPKTHRKATAKARAKEAREANIIRITAKDDKGVREK